MRQPVYGSSEVKRVWETREITENIHDKVTKSEGQGSGVKGL